jgi:glycosyltransferase involved in cell wall biosynthesis
MADRFRIAMIAACPFPAGRGTPIRVLRLAEALAQRGHEVHVVTYHLGDGLPDASVAVHRIGRVPTYRRYEPGPTWQKLLVLDPLLAARTARLLRSCPIDVIHAHHVEGFLVALMARGRRRLPIVYDVHTILESELPRYPLGVARRVLAWAGRSLDRRLPHYASWVLAAHEDIRRRLIAIDPALESRIAVGTNGVELEPFAAASERTLEQRQRRTLVYAGNLAPYQGIEPMLQAFAQLVRKRNDVRLKIVTASPFAPYAGLASALGIHQAIDLVPARFEDLPRHLTDAAVALNPRIGCDGVPQKLLNYMAAGAPIVSFRSSAKHLAHGELGWVVEDGDVAAFADGIDRLLTDPALAVRLGANARSYAQATLTWDSTAAQAEAVYAKIVARPG